MTIEDKMTQFKQWMAYAPMERFSLGLPVTMGDMAEELEVSTRTLTNWKAKQKLDETEPPEQTEDEKWAGFMLHLETQVNKSNPSPLLCKLYSELKGRYQPAKQTQELIHKFDSSFVAKLIIRANRELGDAGYRVAEVQEESTVLPSELRLSPGQSEGSDG